MYAPFALLFPEENDRQRLFFRMPRRNAYQLPPGEYPLFDLYPAEQSPPHYNVFLNVTSPQGEILATLSCQLNTEVHSIQLTLSEMHLQHHLAPNLLAAIESQFNADRGQHWAELILLRAERMQQALQNPSPQAETANTPLRLLRGEALNLLMQYPHEPDTQEAILDTLLGEIREMMLAELAGHVQAHAFEKHHNKIIVFPGKRVDPWADAYWLDLKVELLDLPEIWRQIRVPDTLTLSQFHQVLQVSMGWHNHHLWRFMHTKGEFLSHSQMENMWDEEQDADIVTLHELLTRKGSRLDYEYDFGDSWYHVIRVEARHRPGQLEHPVFTCISGERACPPEDSGGFLGYQMLCKLRNKKRKTATEREWMAPFGAYSPEHFDLTSIQEALQELSAML